jgi:glutamate carboxypeptidase
VSDPFIAAAVEEIAVSAERELEALVDISTPSGDVEAAERAIALCSALLPQGTAVQRPACSTAGCAPDLLARIAGTGRRRLLLLGHVDTVISHDAHEQLSSDGEKLFGPGTCDMKGGVVLALAIARALSTRADTFAELAVLLVTDEEWRTAPFVHAPAFAGYDACLCFEAGERAPGGEEGVVVRRKAAGTIRVTAAGRAAHSGSNPDAGANALLALAHTATTLAELHDPAGDAHLSVVPTLLQSGEALNIVPAAGELTFDVRAVDLTAFKPVLAAVPAYFGGATLDATIVREWPGMDSRAATAPLLAAASEALGRPVVAASRGGASDASHFAASIPLTVDGLGPRGGGAHTPGEFIDAKSLRERAAVALAVATAALA